jgi:poly-gamma-glutamate synthesis protein (capsule biosynthesis protein)
MTAFKISVLFTAAASGLFAASGRVSLCACGDVMLSRDVGAIMRDSGMTYPFSGISSLVKKFDCAFCNLECPISTHGAPAEKNNVFRCRPDSAQGLLTSGFNIFSIANNHIDDYGSQALLDTRDFLTAHHFPCAGSDESAWKAMEPAIVEKNGLKIALLAFLGLPFQSQRGHRACDPQPALLDTHSVLSAIRSTSKKADVVIVSIHWGIQYKHFIKKSQQTIAHACIDAGADLILGHHPHSIQPIERYNGKYICYSLGNCVFDEEFQIGSESMVWCCALSKHTVGDVRLVPVLITKCRPAPAKGRDFYRIESKIRKCCVGSKFKILEMDSLLVLR